MTRPIIGFLAEFRPVPRPADVARTDPVSAADAAAREAARLVEAARAEGFSEGRRAAEAEMADHLALMAQQQAEALDAAHAAWLAESVQVFSEGLGSGLAALEASLAEGMVDAMLPFLAPALRDRTVAELAQALADLMAGQQGALVVVKGPAAIIDLLRVAAGGNPALVLTASESSDVTIEAGDTTIRSQMQAWSDRFRSAFQAPA